MTVEDIWLTVAAEAAFEELLSAAPAQAAAVSDAINDLAATPGRPIDLPGAPPGEPFLAKEPTDSNAPVVIYRRATPAEPGKWLVVSLMSRDDYRAARQAEQALATAPPAVRQFVQQVVGTVAAVTVEAIPGKVSITPSTGSGSSTTGTSTPPTTGQ